MVIGNSLTGISAALKTASNSIATSALNSSHKKKDDGKTGDPMIDSLADSTSDKYQAFNKQQDSLKQTLQQLQSAKASNSDQRKQDAQEKIERIKAQLQALRLLAQVNPKAAAREAARLSKELASAVKEYAAAGGGSSSATATATPATPASTPTDSSANQAAANTASATTVAAGVASAATAEATVSESEGKTSPSNTPSPILQQVNANIADMQKRAGSAKQDLDFVSNVHTVLDQLKAIIQRGKDKHDHKGENDIHEAENNLTDIQTNAIAATASVNIKV